LNAAWVIFAEAGGAGVAADGLESAGAARAVSAAFCAVCERDEQPVAAPHASASASAVAVALKVLRIVPPVARMPMLAEVVIA
jgi:hypothetical protein